MATRVYWAISALGVAPDGSSSATESEFVSGIQSVGITTTFNLEQVSLTNECGVQSPTQPQISTMKFFNKILPSVLW